MAQPQSSLSSGSTCPPSETFRPSVQSPALPNTNLLSSLRPSPSADKSQIPVPQNLPSLNPATISSDSDFPPINGVSYCSRVVDGKHVSGIFLKPSAGSNEVGHSSAPDLVLGSRSPPSTTVAPAKVAGLDAHGDMCIANEKGYYSG